MSNQSKKADPFSCDIRVSPGSYRNEGMSAILEKEGLKLTIVEDVMEKTSLLKIESTRREINPQYFKISDIYRDARNLYSICDNMVYLEPVALKGVVQAIKDFIPGVDQNGFVEREHSMIGYNSDGKFAYIGRVYMPDGKVIISKYNGNESLMRKLERRGSLEGCIGGVKNLIATNTGLSVALLVGLSGIVTYNLRNYDVGNVVLSISGASSNGKTIGGKVAVFPFGNKELIASCDSTISGYIKQSAEYGIIPMIMDDFSINRRIKNQDYISLINSLFDKNSGITGNTKGIKASLCPAIFTNESPLLSIIQDITSATGYRGRVLEIDIDSHELVGSLTEAETLEVFMNENSGQLAPEFIDYIHSQDVLPTLTSKYKKWLDRFRERLEETNLMNRLTKTLASIMVTGEIFNERFGDILKLSSIFNFLADCAGDQIPTAGIQTTPYECVKQYINKNSEKIAPDKKSYSPEKHMGFRDNGNVLLNTKIFDKKFSEIKEILISEGVIIKGRDRQRYPHSIQKNKTRYWFYVIKLKRERA